MRWALPLVWGLSLACSTPVRQLGSDGGAGDAGVCLRPEPVDVLFVLDDTGSMEETQRALAEAADDFLAALDEGCIDYRISVISGDAFEGSTEQAGLLRRSYAGPPFFELVASDSSACRALSVPHGCPRAEPVTSAMSRGRQLGLLSESLQPGTCGSGFEWAFASLRLAVEQTGPGQCNETTFRADARLALIFVFDEDDSSKAIEPEPFAAEIAARWHGAVRAGAIVGARRDVPFEPAACGAMETCGSVCALTPPPGSHMACRTGGCPPGERCGGTEGPVCVSEVESLFSFCRTCGIFAAPDCCRAEPGQRFGRFLRGIEAELRPMQRSGCTAVKGGVCRLASVCQTELATTLVDLARNLIAGR